MKIQEGKEHPGLQVCEDQVVIHTVIATRKTNVGRMLTILKVYHA